MHIAASAATANNKVLSEMDNGMEPSRRLGDEKSRFAVNARKYTHARAIATRPSSPTARGSLLGSESSIDSWQLEESPECREEDKQDEAATRRARVPFGGERISMRATATRVFYSVRRARMGSMEEARRAGR